MSSPIPGEALHIHPGTRDRFPPLLQVMTLNMGRTHVSHFHTGKKVCPPVPGGDSLFHINYTHLAWGTDFYHYKMGAMSSFRLSTVNMESFTTTHSKTLKKWTTVIYM